MKKEDTRERLIKRKYEQTHKEERKKASEQFNTRLPRESYEKICTFLKEPYTGSSSPVRTDVTGNVRSRTYSYC